MYICIDNMELEKVPHCLVKSSLVFVLVEGGCLAALFLYIMPVKEESLTGITRKCYYEIFLRIQHTDNLMNIFTAMGIQPVIDTVDNLYRDCRINEISRSYLNSSSTSHHKGYSILGIHYAT